MRTSFVADVIIFSDNDALTTVITDIVKMKGVSNIVKCKKAAKAIDALTRFQKGLLIIDWDHDLGQLTRVLAANRKIPEGTTRPMLAIASEVSEKLVTTAAEYDVSQIYSEPTNRKGLSAKIVGLMVTANSRLL